jgi:hypothetical protein
MVRLGFWGAWVGMTLAAPLSAKALTLGVAVMDPASAGVAAGDASQLAEEVRAALSGHMKGTPFSPMAPDELRKIQKEMPGCKVGTCDMQVARRAAATVVVSLEASLVAGEYTLAMRLFETREGAQLARAAPAGRSLAEVRTQLAAGVKTLWDGLKVAHNAAVAAVRAGAKTYQLFPAAAATAVATVGPAPPLSGGRRLIEDGEPVQLEAQLRPVRPDLNTCYQVLLNTRPNAKGRVKVSVDVEMDGAISRVDYVEDELAQAQMQSCMTARLRRMKFAASDRPWRIQFPLVFVPAQK